MRATSIAALAFACAVLVVVCGTSAPPERRQTAPSETEADAEPEGAPGETPPSSADGIRPASPPSPAPPCPDDMAYVDTSFCTDMQRRCTDMEQEKTNHLPICHAFAREQFCRVPERRIAFCIDRYEYPNRRGAHPAWMLDWNEAQATCEAHGKRLCWASEWTAACEGPNHSPFPYGWARDHDLCNFDNFYIEPKRFGSKGQFDFYSRDSNVQAKELSRLDQSVRSGSMESCKSGFGVYDLTGNMDEWVTSDVAPQDVSQWAGLKGGAWGHVRNQCRPMTSSHEPTFRYYFVGFRCCSDVMGAPSWTPDPDAAVAPQVQPHDFATEPVAVIGAPGPSPTKFSRNGRAE
jgi:sulfatase modifying factor 1